MLAMLPFQEGVGSGAPFHITRGGFFVRRAVVRRRWLKAGKEAIMARDRKQLGIVTDEQTEVPAEVAQVDATEPAGKAPESQVGPAKNLTLRITPDLDYRLMSVAIKEGKSKRELALKFVEQGVEKHGVDKELKLVFARLVKARPAV
jgi:hypothetical protein